MIYYKWHIITACVCVCALCMLEIAYEFVHVCACMYVQVYVNRTFISTTHNYIIDQNI